MSNILNIKVNGQWVGVPALKGDKGETGNGIVSIVKTSTSGLVDTYTITYSNGNTSTFTVTNGEDAENAITDVTVNGVSVVDGDIAKVTIPTDLGGFTNNAGYIKGISSSDVISALGFTPYNSTNPNNYTSVVESTVSGWGFTKNTGTVTSVNNVSPVNGNVTLSIPAAQVQADWDVTDTTSKAFIKNKPNIPPGSIVDQTYDATSANAQSGVAISGAGFLTGITSSMITNALGYTPYNSTNPNNYTSVVESTVSGWGFTKNTGTVISVNNVSPVNGNVSLTIPTVNDATLTIQKNGTDVQIFSANASSNVTANITVPTSISDLTDDTSTYPVDKADTLTDLTATVTELNYVDGVTSAIQTQIDGKVSKSGDTMTDNLTISKDGVTPKLILTNTSFDPTSTTAPESNRYSGAIEIHGEDDYLTGFFRTRQNTNNYFQSQMGVKRSINGTNYETVISLGIGADGTPTFVFPQSYNVDGQWVFPTRVTLANSVSWNNTSGDVSYSLATFLPNDNYIYEVLFSASGNTGSTSGQFIALTFRTDLMPDVVVADQNRTRTASTTDAGGCFILPVGAGRYIIKGGSSSSNANGTYSLYANAYRRIGTNS